MTRRDGKSLARELAREIPSLPVLLMSGVELGIGRVPGRPQSFLKKPFSRAELLRELAQAISNATALAVAGG